MSRVFWDTNVFIYLFEDEGRHGDKVVTLLQRMFERGDELVTSTLTIGEIMVKPLMDGEESIAIEYEHSIRSHAIVVPFEVAAARRFAEIRSDPSISPPDAIQLACAAVAETDLFITNDERLSRKVIPSVQFIQSLSTVHI